MPLTEDWPRFAGELDEGVAAGIDVGAELPRLAIRDAPAIGSPGSPADHVAPADDVAPADHVAPADTGRNATTPKPAPSRPGPADIPSQRSSDIAAAAYCPPPAPGPRR